jgi:hypothetical protein
MRYEIVNFVTYDTKLWILSHMIRNCEFYLETKIFWTKTRVFWDFWRVCEHHEGPR